MERVTVAAIQACPVFLDQGATIDKACDLVDTAARDGAGLVAFPESFVPAYPDWVWRSKPWDDGPGEWYARLLEQSVVVPSPATDALGDAARRASAYVSVGVTERDASGTTLYNTNVYFAPDGRLLGKHRKLMPTGGERLVWGMGDGSTLLVFDTPFGRVGGLTCWENYMPLARAAMYAQGIDVYLAPTWDNSDVWVPTLRHIAKEGRIFVVGISACIRAGDVPADIPGRSDLYGDGHTDGDEWLSRGNSAIVGPDGALLAGPLIGEEGIVTAELDVDEARIARRQMDPMGHYARPDVFHLSVDTAPRPAVTFDGPPADEGSG